MSDCPACYHLAMNIGKKIVELRKEKGLSQKELAQKIGVHYTSIVRWEKHGGMLDASDIIKLAKVFDVSTDYLLFDNAPRSGKVDIRDLELLKQFEEVGDLTPADLESVKKLLDGFLLRAKMEKKFSPPREAKAKR